MAPENRKLFYFSTCGCIWTIFESIIMLSWSANWIPLLLFTPEFILMSHFKMVAKSTTTILNLRLSTCKLSERYAQNWNYFRFVVAILKDWLAVDYNSIYLASVSSTSPKTYHYSLTSPGCKQHLPNWNYFRFVCRPYLFPAWRRHLAMWILLPLKRSTLKT